MLIDARTLPPGSVVTADLGIIGAGPAGLTVARELSGSGLQVVVVESGDIEADAATQALATGEISGGVYRPPLDHARERRFGGTSNLWDTRWNPMQAGFRGAPLDPIDFAERDWVPDSGWPFDRAHLDPWYARAHVAAGMGPYQYEAERWETPGAPRLPLDQSVLETSVWHFGAQRAFLVERRTEMERAQDVTVLLRANVVALETSADGHYVTAVRAVCLPDKPLTVRARAWVVAAGGIENARLLLLSGIGNGHDLVGRYFMEHQIVRMGYLRPADPSIMERLALYDEREVDGHQVMGKLKFTGDTMQRERLLHMAAAFVPVHRHFRRHRWSASNAAAELARSVRRGRLPERPVELVKEALRGWDFVAARTIRRLSRGRLFRYWDEGPSFVRGGGWSTLPDKVRRWGALDVQVHAEQAPHPDNRVTLAAERDQLGCPRAHLHFEWRPADIESMRRTQQLLRDEFARSGIGLMEIEEVHGHPPLIHPGLHHHMGTTRMHADPCRGVVDEHCRVHGMENLYLAGCSVFPTGGYINPTLTIMALAIRLADRLRSSLSRTASSPALEA